MRPAGITRRRGFAGRLAVATMLPLVVLPFAVTSFLPEFRFSRAAMPLVCEAQRRAFAQEIPAKGELESAVNVEVKCEVKCRNNTWIRILDVIPEGAVVKPGDFLVRLDSSGLETDRLQQEVICEGCESALTIARSNHESAVCAKEAYLRDEFALKQQQTEMKCFVAEESHRTAKETLRQSRRLAARGFLTAKQLEADVFALQKTENDLSAARIELHVLQTLTKARRLKELDSAIATTKAYLAAREQVLKVNQQRLVEIGEQIQKCVVRAPVAGQVVLAHLYHEGHSHLVIPGEMAREGRALIRLPDSSQMQVKAEIDETNIALVKKGLSVTIQLEAFPGQLLLGHVDWVAEYPKEQDWFQDGEKKYEAIVKIDTPLPGLRPGMTTDLNICAQREIAAVQVPVQSVLKHGEQSYVLVTDGDKWEALPVELGPSNGRYMVIRSGVKAGTQVVLDPASYRSKVSLPEIPIGSG
jgi:HlyD family secretion protein